MKFGRSYLMTLTGKSGREIAISFPTTMTFDITHNIFAAANVANFSFFNLSASNRSEISFNQFLKAQPYPMTLRAGYISQVSAGLNGVPAALPIIFKGFANVAYTEKNGSDLVTRINAFDNGDIASDLPSIYFNEANAYTAPQGTLFVDMVQAVMERLKPNGVEPGKIIIAASQLPGPVGGLPPLLLGPPRVFNGRVWKNLEQLASEAKGAHVYIENGKCNMIGQNDTIPGESSLGTIKSETGLLGIPKYTGATILCSCIFEPSLIIGAPIQLDSTTFRGSGSSPAQAPNGPCKIVAYTHRGTISGVESGELVSDITLMQLSTPLGAAS